MNTWTVGQRVLVYDPSERARLGVIAEVLKTKVRLEDGSEWKHSGYRWGSDEWSRDCMFEASEEKIASELARTRKLQLRDWHRAVAWEALPLEVLEQTYALINPIVQIARNVRKAGKQTP